MTGVHSLANVWFKNQIRLGLGNVSVEGFLVFIVDFLLSRRRSHECAPDLSHLKKIQNGHQSWTNTPTSNYAARAFWGLFKFGADTKVRARKVGCELEKLGSEVGGCELRRQRNLHHSWEIMLYLLKTTYVAPCRFLQILNGALIQEQ